VSRLGWGLASLYVGVVAGLAASGFWTDSGFAWQTGVAMLLTLPVLIVALPVIYFLGAGIWNVTDAGVGGPMWPVTLVFTLMFAGVAMANVCVLLLALRTLQRGRMPAQGGPAG